MLLPDGRLGHISSNPSSWSCGVCRLSSPVNDLFAERVLLAHKGWPCEAAASPAATLSQAKEKCHLCFWPMCSWVTCGDPGVCSELGTQKTPHVQLLNEGRGSAWVGKKRVTPAIGWSLGDGISSAAQVMGPCTGRWLGDRAGFS